MNDNVIFQCEQERHPNIRELTLMNGITFPSDEELVMLILGRGTKNNPIQKMAAKVLEAMDSSNETNLIHNLTKIEGMGKTRALIITAALELGRRRRGHLHCRIQRPKDIVPFVRHYTLKPVEHFITATINGAHELMSIRLVSVGTLSKTLVHPREIFADPVSEHASGIICCHNHPCGQCYPSTADIETTKQIFKAAAILGISLMDHIIITRDAYFSFLEHGILDSCREAGSESE